MVDGFFKRRNERLSKRKHAAEKREREMEGGRKLTAACMPACRRTPMASYMTMRLKPRQTGKRASLVPWQRATEAESAVQRAECDEGIPPELNSIPRSHFLSTKKLRKTFVV